jgi:hypothetical protein
VSGIKKDGTRWPIEGRTDGRHIYVDPDFTEEDQDRFYWGTSLI